MDKLTFAPLIDIPLVSITLAFFILHFNRWAFRNDLDTSADVASRLPSARFRVIVLMVGFLFLCWLFDFAAWSIFAFLAGIGLAIAIFSGWSLEGGTVGLFGAALFIREWAFGFPQLVLHPPGQVIDPSPPKRQHRLIGKSGTTTSPLRPIGDACIDGTIVTVACDDGRLIESGTPVVVSCYKNGRLYVSTETTTPL